MVSLGPSGRILWGLLWDLGEPLGELLWELSCASVGASMRALWNISWAKQGRGVAGMDNIKEKLCILCASCAEPSEARLRAADDSALSLFVNSVGMEIEDASDLQKRACSQGLSSGVSFPFLWRASRACYHRFAWLVTCFLRS